MMTLAMGSIGFGLALSMTGGVPVYGMPSQFGATLGFGKLLGVPVPVYVTVVVILGMYVLLNWTRIGRYFYAIGGNIKASALSGISTRSYLFLAYVLCGFLASLGGVMLTARLETGEANIGAAGFPFAVHNRTRAKAEPLAAGGAAVAASAAEAAERARIVITMLADDQAIETLAEAFSSRRPGWTASRCSRRSTARSSLRR